MADLVLRFFLRDRPSLLALAGDVTCHCRRATPPTRIAAARPPPPTPDQFRFHSAPAAAPDTTHKPCPQPSTSTADHARRLSKLSSPSAADAVVGDCTQRCNHSPPLPTTRGHAQLFGSWWPPSTTTSHRWRPRTWRYLSLAPSPAPTARSGRHRPHQCPIRPLTAPVAGAQGTRAYNGRPSPPTAGSAAAACRLACVVDGTGIEFCRRRPSTRTDGGNALKISPQTAPQLFRQAPLTPEVMVAGD